MKECSRRELTDTMCTTSLQSLVRSSTDVSSGWKSSFLPWRKAEMTNCRKNVHLGELASSGSLMIVITEQTKNASSQQCTLGRKKNTDECHVYHILAEWLSVKPCVVFQCQTCLRGLMALRQTMEGITLTPLNKTHRDRLSWLHQCSRCWDFDHSNDWLLQQRAVYQEITIGQLGDNYSFDIGPGKKSPQSFEGCFKCGAKNLVLWQVSYPSNACTEAGRISSELFYLILATFQLRSPAVKHEDGFSSGFAKNT